LCGNLKEKVCLNSGTDEYVVDAECQGMIDSITSPGGPFVFKCPNNREISHYVIYPCEGVGGTKYELDDGNLVDESCVCTSPPCGKTCDGGSGGGDPHFRTHDGTLYSYHGECDLVMVHSPTFNKGLGLDVHARTTIVGGTWSLVSQAAIRIGSDIIEVQNDGTYYINGQSNVALPTLLASNYSVDYSEERVEDEENSIRSWYHIAAATDAYSADGKIEVTNYKNMLSINVKASLDNTVGMFGTSSKRGMIGRDGATIIADANEMGAQWQVRDNEPMLFREPRAPQFPEACILPTEAAVQQARRRLRATDGAIYQQAQDACKFVSKQLHDFCVQDIVMSGDTSLAHTYVGGVF
jgi:von Willebrand factor type D domain